METKQPKLMRSRTETAIAVLVVVASVAAGSAVLAQESSTKPSAPPATDQPVAADGMGMGAGGSGMMGMGSDSKGMMSGMQQMKCCGQGMGHADHGASGKQDEKK